MNNNSHPIAGDPPADRLMTEIETGALTRTTPRTLKAWRYLGTGPRFFKIGRSVRYSKQAVLAWIEERAFNSTEEAKIALHSCDGAINRRTARALLGHDGKRLDI
jgi:predicted DNA-binding transcriptional regulator AlpA